MNIDSGANPVQADLVRATLNVDTQTYSYHQEPPPPYTSSVTDTSQPVVQQTVIIQPPLKDKPIFYNCPRCMKRVLTKVEFVNTKKTHTIAGFICGFTIWCFLCCLGAIPYLIPAFKKAEHYCSNCNAFLGAYSKV